VPVPAYSGGEKVRQLVQEYWLPALRAHRPQMIFISAGFDAHKEDDMGGMGLVEADYAWITRQIMAVARSMRAGTHRQLPGRRLQPVGARPQRRGAPEGAR
jgi:acetoin utilization deacetylase AcuC-like enzyme